MRPLLVSPLIGGIALGSILIATPVHADDAAACTDSFEKVQKLRARQALIDARQEAIECSSERCPSLIQNDCGAWLAELESEIPSVVVAARDGRGDDVIEATLSIDGDPIAERLDGAAIDLDPGEHEVVVTRADTGESAKRTVLVRVGEKRRVVDLTFAPMSEPSTPEPPPPETPPADDGPSWVGPAVLWGVGGAGVIVGAVAGGIALSRQSDLEGTCPTPATCDPSLQGDIDAMNTSAHVSTVGFAVGGAAMVVAVVLTVLASGDDTPEESAWFATSEGVGVRF